MKTKASSRVFLRAFLFRAFLSSLSVTALSLAVVSSVQASQASPAAAAVNRFGLDFYNRLESDKNVCFSPFSIETALAMVRAGTAGETRAEMDRALYLPAAETNSDASFAALLRSLGQIETESAARAKPSAGWGGNGQSITLRVSNRLFGQEGYPFRESYLALLRDKFGAPLELLNFAADPAGATHHINAWVEERTNGRIADIIPGPLAPSTRLLLINALYLKAPWATEFSSGATVPKLFYLGLGSGAAQTASVATMNGKLQLGYAKRDGYTLVTLPYNHPDLQCVILVPDAIDGLKGLESKLTPALLEECAQLPPQEIILSLPKFKIAPPTIDLVSILSELGIKRLFQPNAELDPMAAPQNGLPLLFSKVYHKAFISIDEKGTEAAAATVAMALSMGIVRSPTPPIEVKVDRPFLFAIQHRPSGSCLFLGRVVDPR